MGSGSRGGKDGTTPGGERRRADKEKKAPKKVDKKGKSTGKSKGRGRSRGGRGNLLRGLNLLHGHGHGHGSNTPKSGSSAKTPTSTHPPTAQPVKQIKLKVRGVKTKNQPTNKTPN